MSVHPTEFVQQGSLHSSHTAKNALIVKWSEWTATTKSSTCPLVIPLSHALDIPSVKSHKKASSTESSSTIHIYIYVFLFIFLFLYVHLYLDLYLFINIVVWFIFLFIFICLFISLYCIALISIFMANISSTKRLFEEDFTSFLHRCSLCRLSERPRALHAIIQVLKQRSAKQLSALHGATSGFFYVFFSQHLTCKNHVWSMIRDN